MALNQLQDFYRATVKIPFTAGTGKVYVNILPTVSAGIVVFSPANASLREIVRYSNTGTDGTGLYLDVSARGLGGTIEQAHAVDEPIRMNVTAEHWADMITEFLGKVNTTGDENIGGVKTFLESPIVPTPIADMEAATKKYSDDGISNLSAAITSALLGKVNNTGDETVSGIKTFDSSPLVPDATTGQQAVSYAQFVAAVISGGIKATVALFGLVRLSVAPVSAADPVALGGNDPRVSPNDYAVATGSSNAYIVTLGITALNAGQVYAFKANFTNTDTATVNFDGLGAKTIKKKGGTSNLSYGDIQNGQIVEMRYDGINFQMLSGKIEAMISKVKCSIATAIDTALSFNTEVYTEVGTFFSGGASTIINLAATSNVRGGSVSAVNYCNLGQRFTVTGNGGMIIGGQIREYSATSGGTAGVEVRRSSDNVVVATGGCSLSAGSDATIAYTMNPNYVPAGDYYIVFKCTFRDMALCYRNTDAGAGELWSINTSTGNLVAAQTGNDLSVTINIDSTKVFNVLATGTYLLAFNYLANTAGARSATVYVNGTAALTMGESASTTDTQYAQTVIKLNAGDLIWVVPSSDVGAGTSLELAKIA